MRARPWAFVATVAALALVVLTAAPRPAGAVEYDVSFEPEHIVALGLDGAIAIAPGDTDRDGDVDLVVAAWDENRIFHIANNGDGTFGQPTTITEFAVWPWDVTLTDIDGDGWDDMVMCSNFDSKVAYNHNEGGTSWGPQRVITVSAQGCRAVGVGDIDNDGAVDVVAGAYNDENDVSWWRNEGQREEFESAERVITKRNDGTRDLAVADLDGDGDLDAVSVGAKESLIAWYENLGPDNDHKFKHWRTKADLPGLSSIVAEDVDNDGRPDLVVASEQLDQVFWLWNTGLSGKDRFGNAIQIIAPYSKGAYSVKAVDIDRDGDLDVVVANIEGGVVWYDNANAIGTVWHEHVIDDFAADFRRMGVATADLNGDGTEDVIVASSAGDRISWYPNIQTPRLTTSPPSPPATPAPTGPPSPPPSGPPSPPGPTPSPTPAPTPAPPPPTASPPAPPGATLSPTYPPAPPASTAAPPSSPPTSPPASPATTAAPASGGAGQFNVDGILGNNEESGIQLSLIPFIPIAFVAGGVLVYLVLSNRRPRKSASVSSGYSRGSYGRDGYGGGSYYDDRATDKYLVNGGTGYSYDSYDRTGGTSPTTASGTYYSSTGGYTGASTSGA